MPIGNRLYDSTPDLERRVRSTDADTSWAAARISKAANETVKDFILDLLEVKSPLTDDQIIREYHLAGGRRTPQRVRTAREELTHPKTGDPLVVEYNVIGLSDAGNAARRWELA